MTARIPRVRIRSIFCLLTNTTFQCLQLGLELVINILAPDEPTRYFEAGANRHQLRWAAAVPASDLIGGQLRIVDHWQRVAAAVKAPGAGQFWIAPIETVSESEEGFERVYQGSQILALWPVDSAAGSVWRGQLTLGIEPAPSKMP